MPEFFDFFDPTPEEQNVVLVDAATAPWPNPFRNEITRRSDNPTVANRKFRIEPLNCGPARRPRPRRSTSSWSRYSSSPTYRQTSSLPIPLQHGSPLSEHPLRS